MFSAAIALLALGSLSLAAPFPSPNTTADAGCSRAFLQASVDAYIAAQIAGRPADLLRLAAQAATDSEPAEPRIAYTEDGAPRSLWSAPTSAATNRSTIVLATPLAVDHRHSLLDTTQCATYTELIAVAAQRVIGTQMRFSSSPSPLSNHSAPPVLRRIDTLATRPGDWAFNASGTLHYARREDGRWGPILPVEARSSRAVIQAAADAYLDLFADPSVVVPWGTPCDRLEGSWYTGTGAANDTCNIGVPAGIPITDRRYVIDETVGAVDALVRFATRPDSHEFRVENGKIRFVHTLTIMRNVTGDPYVSLAPAPAPAPAPATVAGHKRWQGPRLA